MKKRWDDYRLEKGKDIKDYFAQDKFKESKFLYILGMGFDDRMCIGLENLIDTFVDVTICCIKFNEGENSSSKKYQSLIENNAEKLSALTKGKKVIEKTIEMWIQDGNDARNVTEINTSKLVINNIHEIDKFTDIIIDISALPQSIYIGLINRILIQFFNSKRIYIIVCENYYTDMQTKAVEPDEFAHDVHGFIGFSIDNSDDYVIWFPVLGEIDEIILQKYFDYLNNNQNQIAEICPMLPFPSIDERRADEIIKEYRKQLFSQWQVEKKNIIYASERNPFQVYRQLFKAAEHYSEVMKPIGDCKFVFSTITSKLMSVGTLLAAIALKDANYKVGFLGISNRGYVIEEKKNNITVDNEMFCLCLSDDGF